MQNARLDEAQAGIKIAGRNINNLRYADDTTFMAESKEELKRLLIKVKEESEKAGLKLNIKKTKLMASDAIISQQMEQLGKVINQVTKFVQHKLESRLPGEISRTSDMQMTPPLWQKEE